VETSTIDAVVRGWLSRAAWLEGRSLLGHASLAHLMTLPSCPLNLCTPLQARCLCKWATGRTSNPIRLTSASGHSITTDTRSKNLTLSELAFDEGLKVKELKVVLADARERVRVALQAEIRRTP